jgi:CysZ protein
LVTGFISLLGGARTIIRLHRAWPLALVPAASFVLLEALWIALSLDMLRPWVRSALSGEGELWSYGATALSWLATLLGAAMGWIVSALLAPVISAPALERIVKLVEADLGAPPRAPIGFFRELGCGLESLLVGVGLVIPLGLLLAGIGLLAPPTAVVTTPLQFLVGALGVAWSLLDYPLTLRGVGVRERLRLMTRNGPAVLGFGLAFGIAFWLPCAGLLLLPIGVAAATELVFRLNEMKPT